MDCNAYKVYILVHKLRGGFKSSDIIQFCVADMETPNYMNDLFSTVFAVVMHLGTFFLLSDIINIKKDVSHKRDFTIQNIKRVPPKRHP